MIITQPDKRTVFLYPGQVLTVSADSVSNGTVCRLGDHTGDPIQGCWTVSPGNTRSFGPFDTQSQFLVSPSVGVLTVSIGLWTAAQVAYGTLRVAHCLYDFAVDGGAQGTIVPTNSDTIPDNAILIGSTINSPTAVASAGAATVAVGTSAGSSTTAIKGATGKASYSTDAVLNGVPVFATPVKMTAAGTITFTIGAADLTAGVVEVWVFYVVAAG